MLLLSLLIFPHILHLNIPVIGILYIYSLKEAPVNRDSINFYDTFDNACRGGF